MQKLCRIPQIPLDDINSFLFKLFSLNDELHFTNGLAIFKLNSQNQPEFVVERKCQFYCSFCGCTICFYRDFKSAICLLKNDYSE